MEGNTAGEVVSATTGDPKDREIADLRAKLAQYEADKVARPSFNGEVPRYKIVDPKGVFLEDDTLHTEGEIIDYLGAPNIDAMLPMNAAAEERVDAEIRHLTSCAQEAAQLNGRPFRGLIRDGGTIIATALQDARRDAGNLTLGSLPHIRRAVDRGDVPVMPHTPEAVARRRGKPGKAQNVVAVQPPAPRQKEAPKPVNVVGRDMGYQTSGS